MSDTIEPVRKSIELACDAATAFAFYAEHLNEWWPRATHSLGLDRTVAVAMECAQGGRIYETQADGATCDWGRVLVWEPGKRVVHSWFVGRPESEATEVEVRFTDLPGGRSRVDLEHRHWEKLGSSAAETRNGYDSGWEGVFKVAYGGYAARKAAA